MSSDSSHSYDPITGLPWSSALLPSATSLALTRDTRAVYLELRNLTEVGAVFGDRVAQLLFRQLVRRLRSLLDPQDLMGRHSGTGLAIFTARSPTEVQDLVSSISRQVRAVAILTHGELLPEARVGVASVRRAADERDALTAIEASVTAAERAALAQEIWKGPAEVPAPIHPPEPRKTEPPAVRAAPERGFGEGIVIRRIGIAMEGTEATAMLTLTWGAREAEAEATGTNTPRERLILVGEATAAAVMTLTSGERSVSRVLVDEFSQENDRFVRAVVEVSGPGGPEQMSATVPVQGTTYSTVARAVVQAMEPRIREIPGTS